MKGNYVTKEFFIRIFYVIDYIYIYKRKARAYLDHFPFFFCLQIGTEMFPVHSTKWYLDMPRKIVVLYV